MTLSLTVSKAKSSIPVRGYMGAIRRWEDVHGYRIQERGRDGHGVKIWCRTWQAAVRIVVALFEGRHDLVGQILLAEQWDDFCVEDRSDEFRALVEAGHVLVVATRKTARKAA
jgi:hypothetical protein